MNRYRSSKLEAVERKVWRHGLYNGGRLTELARSINSLFKLGVPTVEPHVLALGDQNKPVRRISKYVLQEDASATAWNILKNATLKLSVCIKTCGIMGVCFSCGVAAKLFEHILEDKEIKLPNIVREDRVLLEIAWMALNHRSDVRGCPTIPEADLNVVVNALIAMGDRSFLVSGIGTGLERLGTNFP